MLIDSTDNESQLREIKDSVIVTFQHVTNKGALCEEKLYGCRFDFKDCELHSDAIHRGGGSIMPAAKRLFYACQLASRPTLIQPIYTYTVFTL